MRTEVDAEVDEVVDTIIVEGVESLDNQDLRGVGLLGRSSSPVTWL